MSSVKKRRVSTPHGSLSKAPNSNRDSLSRKNRRVSFASNLAKVWTYNKNDRGDRCGASSSSEDPKGATARECLGELEMTKNIGSIIHVRKGKKRNSAPMELTEDVGKILADNKKAQGTPDAVKNALGMDLTQTNLGKILSKLQRGPGSGEHRQSLGMEMTANVGSILCVNGAGAPANLSTDLDESSMNLTDNFSQAEEDTSALDASQMDLTVNHGGILSHLSQVGEDSEITMELTGVVRPEDTSVSWDASPEKAATHGTRDQVDSFLQDTSIMTRCEEEANNSCWEEAATSGGGSSSRGEEGGELTQETQGRKEDPDVHNTFVEELSSQYIDAAVLQQKQWACDNLGDAVQQLSADLQASRDEAAAIDSVALEPKHLETVRAYAFANTNSVWAAWCAKLQDSTIVRLQENLKMLNSHIERLERCTEACKRAQHNVHKANEDSIRRAQDAHGILSGLHLWNLSLHSAEKLVFKLDPQRPLQPYALTLDLQGASEEGEEEEEEEACKHIVGASIEPLGSAISDPFTLGLIKSTACAAVLSRTSTTAQLRQALEEISFRLGRVHHLLSEVAALEKRFQVETRYGPDDTNACVRVTFSNLSTGSRFCVSFTNLHFGYPFGDFEFAFTRQFGQVRKQDVSRILLETPPGFGRLSRCCKRLAQL